MAAREFIYLDTAPINEALLHPDKTLTEALDYRRQLNLAINCYQAENALSKQQEHMTKLVKGKNVTTSILNIAIESYLSLLIQMTTIASLDLNELSPHYQRRKLLVENQFISPNSEYLERMLFASTRTWGTSYGSLGYFLHLQENSRHYLHPSQIIHSSVLSLINQSKSADFLRNFPSNFERLISQEDAFTDIQIYQLAAQLLKEIPDVRESIEQLDFYEEWLPKVISWYLKASREGSVRQVPEQGTPDGDAYTLLAKIAQACLMAGLDETSFNSLSYMFVHQSIPPVFFSLMDDLLLLRKKAALGDIEDTEMKELITGFIKAITINTKVGLLRSTSQSILENVAAPGGYNLLLVSLAATLLNRAFILTHPSKTIYSNYIISPLKNSFPELMQFLGRVYRLLYLAGYCLKKTNLDHLQLTGVNLITLSLIEDNTPLRITDLSL